MHKKNIPTCFHSMKALQNSIRPASSPLGYCETKFFFVALIFLILPVSGLCQDSLIFINNNYMTGEIKSLDKGVLTIETPYSKSDFTIEWNKVKKVYTKTSFMITHSNGDRLAGTLRSSDSVNVVVESEATSFTHRLTDIVLLKSVSKKFWDNFRASVSLGLSVTRAQSLKQFTSRSSAGYFHRKWSMDASANTLRSTQEDADDVRRNDGGINFNYFLPKDWYVPISVTYLSNSEQMLDLRLLEKVGLGKYVIHSNKATLGFSAGANYNMEDFSDETPDRESWEGFIGTQLNLFDIGDLKLLTTLVAYPSFTESDRLRSDFAFDAKYEFPYDFFIQFGVTVNYDNKPVEDAPKTDYVYQTTIGWSW